MVKLSARVARSLVTVIFLTFVQVIGAPILAPQQSSPQANAATFDSTGLILKWDMQDLSTYGGSGTTLGDASFNSSTGTFMKAGTAANPTYTSSTAKYLTIAGNNTNYNYVQSGNLKSKLDATSAGTLQNISIFTWVYPTGNGIVVDEHNADFGWQDSQIEMADDKFSFRLWNSTEVVADVATPKNYWYYVGITYDFASLTMKAYINGKKVGELTGFDRMTPWETNGAYTIQYSVGRYDGTHLGSASGGNFRFGALQIYNKPISQSVIIQNYEYDLYWYGPSVGNPVDKSQYVNRSDTFSVTACAGMRQAAACNYKWEASSDGGTTWSTVGTSSTSYGTPILQTTDNGKKFRVTATDPGAAGDVPLSIQNYAVSTSALLTVTKPPGAETDTALSFSSTGKYAEVADTANSPFDTTGTFTLEAWVNPSNACPASGAVISKLSYMVYCQTGVWYVMALANGSSGSGVSTTIPVEANEWHHLAFTKTSASGNILFYYDGVLVQTVASGATSMTPNDHAFQIGRYDNNSSYWFQGQIDEVRVYNTQRSQSQILTDMSAYGSISDSDLMAYYDFNEGSGTILVNRKVNSTAATDLTITGGPLWLDIKSVETATLVNYTITKFPRTYINEVGGWKVPTGVSKASALVVAGGGGGGARAGGGGGAGGLVYRPLITLSTGAIETITVGQGGLGGYSVPALTNRQGLNGQDSQMGNHTTAVGGGGAGGAGDTGNTYRAGRDGGSGGAASGAAAGDGSSAAYGSGQQNSSKGYGAGNNGGSGMSGSYWNGGGGGGSGGAGSSASTTSWVAGNGGAGTLDPVGGSNLCLAAGGGGGTVNGGTKAGDGGTCSSGTVTAGAGTIGAVIAGSATANSGSGGGGSGYNTTDVGGGHGGSGVIIIRWITASKPTFTAPTIAYLNAGMTETFTVNVAQDSATANLTRTFRWESSTTGANGTYSLIKQGTGANNAFFAWVPSDTSTSGANFTYRVIVTDSDTAGLFIVDTSTPVYAVINRALVVSGSSTINKAINVSKNETFTITLGTSTYRPTLTPVIPGITLDTATAGSAVIRIGDTVTVGTYYETLTVVDSVSAVVNVPLTIIVAAPPTLLNTLDITSDNLIYHLDAGNSRSILLEDGAVATSVQWKDLSGNGKDASTSGTYDSGGFAKTCASPTYSSNNGGSLAFNGSSTCYWSPYIGNQLDLNVTVEVWVRLDGSSMNIGSMIVQQNYNPASASNLSFLLGDSDASTGVVKFGLWDGGAYRQSSGISLTQGVWTHIAGTYDGANFKIYKDGSLANTSASYTAGLGNTLNYSGTLIGRRGSSTGSPFFNGSIATVRIYKVALTAAQILANYNATKYRFLTENATILKPAQKYGSLQSETYTVTSGAGAKSTTFTYGDRLGIDWDTSTVANQVKLTLQESLTAGTFYDTATVTDSLGQSTYLPIKMSIAKADTLTVTLRNPKTVVYTGLQAVSLPDINIVGLKNSDTGTAIRLYSAPASAVGAPETYTAIVRSSLTPTDVETYTVSVDTLTSLSVGSLANYEGVVYETSTLTITKAKQPALMINYFGALAGYSHTLRGYAGGGPGAFTETVTAGGTGTNCTLNGHVLSNSSPSTSSSTCVVIVTKAASRNYFVETLTATIYFFAFGMNYQSQTGGGAGIGLSGVTSFFVDPNAAPTITGLSTTTLSLSSPGNFTITGAGFGLSPLTVKFWRNKSVTVTSTDGTSLVIPISSILAAGATTGRIIVINANGSATSTQTLTITS